MQNYVINMQRTDRTIANIRTKLKYRSPILRFLNCVAAMHANVGPRTPPPSAADSAAPPTNRSMSLKVLNGTLSAIIK